MDAALAFVDHHAHVLAMAARRRAGYDLARPESIADYHRRVAAAGSSPMDEPLDAGLRGGELVTAFASALRDAAALGLVGLTEAGLRDWSHWDALLALREEDGLAVDVHVLIASGLEGDAQRIHDAIAASDGRLAVAGMKFYADGWLGPRTCACSTPFADVSPADRGVLFQDADRLASRFERAAAMGLRPATHAIGDRAIEAVLDAYERVYGGVDGCRAAKPRIEHAQLLRDDLIERIAQLGVVCCIQPCFASSDAAHVAHALGDAFPKAYAWDQLIAAGASVVAGSDFPIETLDPHVGLDHLVSGAHALDLETAQRLMTTPLPSA